MHHIMRVNPETTLGAFPLVHGDKVPKSHIAGNYVKRERDPNEALPPSMNLWKRPVYKPEQGYVRAGGNNFLSIKSRGF